VHLISTQFYTSEYLGRALPSNPTYDVFVSPILPRGYRLVPKPIKNISEPLNVCFTSLGDVHEKGADLYISIASRFKQRFPDDHVIFYAVGNVPNSSHVTHVSKMTQHQLSHFYHSTIDIVFNLDRTVNSNGWPLGCEAVVAGALLFSTDRFNMNSNNNLHFGAGFHRVTEGFEWPTIERIHHYAHDRFALQRDSLSIQKQMVAATGYPNQMGKIVNIITRVLEAHFIRWNKTLHH
jgi:hypothetical protein